jgi:serine/threonine protein kinase
MLSPPWAYHLRYRGPVERGDLTGAILDGRYRVLEAVAEGAMGVVYRAERVKLGRIVAVKVLHDVLPNELSARKRFEIEAMAMAKLEHPHCASVLDVGIHDDRPYVVMDFVSGQNLKDVVAEGPQPIPRATEIVRQVLSGLAHAHEHGIIHRDIKPANLVLSQKTGLGDHVKILDFGLARLHDTGQNLTTGIVVGTPAYMAPEQIRGQPLDHRADLYACGVLLFELLTGHKPFHSEKDDPIEVCKMHLSDPIPRLDAMLPGVDFGELEAVVARALAKQRDERYASAQEYAAAIDAAVPRRPSHQAILRMPSSPSPSPSSSEGAIQLASADVMSVGDVSYPPSFEVRSADMMSAVPADPPVAPPAAAAAARADVRARTATPPSGLARRPSGAPGTFLGLALNPRPATPLPITSEPEPVAAEPVAAEPVAAEPVAAEPVAAEPVAAEPAATDSRPARAPGQPRRRTIAIIGGVLLAGVVLVAVLASRGGSPVPVDAGVVAGSAAAGPSSPPDPGAEIVARSNELLAQGDREAALDLLNRSRRQYPASAALAYAAGRIYFAKYYWTEGLKSFRDAIRIDPAYRADPELIKIVLRGFIMTPSYNDELASFLREDIGSATQPLLEETARDHPNAAIRSRAAGALRRYH